MRLIDADELKKDIDGYDYSEEGYSDRMDFKFIYEVIDNQPPVEAKPVEWIPCSERLPELTEGTEYFKQSECCLVALKWWDCDITESVGWYNESGLWSDDGKNCKVIAWMPLPEAYKEERGGKNE